MSPPSTPCIPPEQGQALVQMARKTLMERFGIKLDAAQEQCLACWLAHPALQVKAGTFVTLKIDGRLRGCIGSFVGQSLIEGVQANAVNAAFHDPRFPPLAAEELHRVAIEVSILTPSQPLPYLNSTDLIAKLRPGLDGVTIRKGLCSATFLPQVWEQLPGPEVFLTHLCIKAGLGADAWRMDKLEVETYQVQCFEVAA
jgi:AmmeMemoRadiSam system protein A